LALGESEMALAARDLVLEALAAIEKRRVA
jgi:hypothetical protein